MIKPQRFRVPVAVHMLLMRDTDVLLLRRFNTGYEDGKLSVPAGHLDGNESVIEAGIREAWEETGIRIGPTDIRIVQVMHRFAEEERIDYFLTASTWEGEIINSEPEKCDLLAWFPVDDLPGNTIPYVAYGIQCWRDNVNFPQYGR